MARRLLVPKLVAGAVELPPDQAHHARDVLRLDTGDDVELFTADGEVAAAVLVEVNPGRVVAEVREVRRAHTGLELTIASAVPKAARADWMIEKLSELGVARFVPLTTERSVVHPEGKNKIDRWQRLAAEAAKQSRRAGVMTIDGLTPVKDVVEQLKGPAAFLSTAPGGTGLVSFLTARERSPAESAPPRLTLLVGPEGGWSEGEVTWLSERHLTPVTLGATILRVETAAIAAAAVVAATAGSPPRND